MQLPVLYNFGHWEELHMLETTERRFAIEQDLNKI